MKLEITYDDEKDVEVCGICGCFVLKMFRGFHLQSLHNKEN